MISQMLFAVTGDVLVHTGIVTFDGYNVSLTNFGYDGIIDWPAGGGVAGAYSTNTGPSPDYIVYDGSSTVMQFPSDLDSTNNVKAKLDAGAYSTFTRTGSGVYSRAGNLFAFSGAGAVSKAVTIAKL